jgi:hypothetical protein
MFGIGNKEKQEVVKIDRHSFYIDRRTRTLQQVDDPRKMIDLNTLKVDPAQGGMPVLWDRLTGLPYEGYKPLQGMPLHTVLLVLPMKLLEGPQIQGVMRKADNSKPIKQPRFRQ